MADIEMVIEELDRLKSAIRMEDSDRGKINVMPCISTIDEAIKTIRELQEQIPKWYLVNDCDFCKNIKIGIPNWTFIDDELETFKNSSGIAVEIRNILKEPCLVFTNSADKYGYGYIKINYCPSCGRKIKVVE